MNEKKKILVFLNYYLPGYKAGGPIRAIENLVNRLHESHDFSILTRGNDEGDGEYPGIKKNTWVAVGATRVRYLTQGPRRFFEIARAIVLEDFSHIYLNSFFSGIFSIFPLIIIKLLRRREPIVLAPRGEFSSGALGIKRPRKTLYIKIAKLWRLHANITWQASTQAEADDILKVFPTARCKIAKELAPVIALQSPQPIEKQSGTLKIAFISRVSRMKNLDFALQILADIGSANIFFDIYGPIQDRAYWKDCTDEIARLPLNIKAEYKGELKHFQVAAELSAHHVFFLPTLGENFGYAILEALIAGRPVIVSDETPWRRLLDAGIGFDIPLQDSRRFRSAIECYAEMGQAEYDAVTRQVFSYMQKYVSDLNEQVRASEDLFA